MARATQPFHNRLAVVFDYDDTLADDSFDDLLHHIGLERASFNEDYVDPLEAEGWNHIMARFYGLMQAFKEHDTPLTHDLLERMGQEAPLFDGVAEVFDRIRTTARDIVEDVEVEFYLITSGLVESIRATSIADEFEAIWGCAFHYDEDDQAVFLKRIVTHPEKTRYLLHLAKHGGDRDDVEPEAVYEDIPDDEKHVPLSQVIYVGDGASDMPAFRLMNDEGGMAIGVYHEGGPDGWRGLDEMFEERRVQNLAPPGYTDGDELLQSILLAVESIAKRIALRKLGAGQ